jgi:ribosomal protein S18 acetylase RimI-like enzyme
MNDGDALNGLGFVVRSYLSSDREAVAALWRDIFAADPPWNVPEGMIDRKQLVQPELFLVGTIEGAVVATVLAGYDGVRGWIYHLAVARRWRRRGFGTRMMRAAEERLALLGCPKINLQVREGNEDVVAFYRSLGYRIENHVSMGRLLRGEDAGRKSGD